MWAIEGYEIGKEVSVGKASVSYAEPGEDDFNDGSVGWRSSRDEGNFQVGQDVMGLVFQV